MSLRTLGDSGGIAARIRSAAIPPAFSVEGARPPESALWHAFRERYTRARVEREAQTLDIPPLREIGPEGDFEPVLGSCWHHP
jgi:hypothetical protein